MYTIAAIAQLGERQTSGPKIAGSSPAGGVSEPVTIAPLCRGVPGFVAQGMC